MNAWFLLSKKIKQRELPNRSTPSYGQFPRELLDEEEVLVTVENPRRIDAH